MSTRMLRTAAMGPLTAAIAARVKPARPDPLRVPSVLRCFLLIFVVKVVLGNCGFAWTIRRLRRRLEAIATTEHVDAHAVKACEYRVAMAAALYPGRARCLEQSLVLYYLLRRQGVAVKYCQGVQAYPFQAHGWIEYQGEAINDVGEHVRLFARLPEQLP
jgi:hypothetical protein